MSANTAISPPYLVGPAEKTHKNMGSKPLEKAPVDSQEPTGDREDVFLMDRIAAGDEYAMRRLIDKWKNPLVNFFYRSLQSHCQAEDLAQVVLVRIYQASQTYEPTAKFSTFLFHIARRVLINEHRKQTRKPLEPVDPQDFASISGENHRSDLDCMEIEEAFQSALGNLPPNQRQAILLLKQQELSYQEIADIMEATESAVKTWIFRARQQLKDTLKDLL